MQREFVIYSITNTSNKKRYIGSSVSVRGRWKTHRWQLNKGIHANAHLQRAWSKYGKSSFSFDVLETSEGTKDDKQRREDHYIETFHTRDRSFGYNISSANLTENELTRETKNKIALSLKNNPLICKKIVQYDIFTGKFVKEWPSSMEIKRVLGGNNSAYIQCCKHNSSHQSVKGYGWAYSDEYFTKSESEWAKPSYIPHFKISTRDRPIIGTNLSTGQVIGYKSIKMCADELKINQKCLQRAVSCQGEYGRKSYKGYEWQYAA